MPVEVTPEGTVVGSRPIELAVPSNLPPSSSVHFFVQVSRRPDFSVVDTQWDTEVSQSGAKYFDGTVFKPFPASGVPDANAGRRVIFVPMASPVVERRFFRARAKVGSDLSDWVAGAA